MSSENKQGGGGRWQVPMLAAVFFGPVILAWIMVAMDWYPQGTTNAGQLVQPPQRLQATDWRWPNGEAFDADWFKGRWTVLMIGAGDCSDACRGLLDKLTRARLALDKDMTRVTLLLARPENAKVPDDTAAHPVVLPEARIRELLGSSPGKGKGRAVHLVDSQGLRMMRYPVPLDTEGLVADLEQLLDNADRDVERIQRLRHEDSNS